MKGLLRHIFPLSLRVRFLLATAGVVLVLSLAYGMVALVGYSVSFDKTTFRLLRGESNLFYMLARWENGAIDVDIPENLNMESPTVTLKKKFSCRSWAIRSMRRKMPGKRTTIWANISRISPSSISACRMKTVYH